jgi:transposase
MIPILFSKSILKKLPQELQVAYQLNKINLYRTIQALIWYGEGTPATEIAEFLPVTSRTIYNGIKSVICKSFYWLFRQRYLGRGRKSKMTKAQKRELDEMIISGPEANGFECGGWNTALIAELI